LLPASSGESLTAMNLQAILFLLAQLSGSTTESEICPFALKEMALPIPEPRISVFDRNGNSLAPSNSGHKLEFSRLNVRVPVVPGATESYWVPADMDQAAIGLKVMLPADFYTRLLRGYGGEGRKWTAVGDLATSERWDDLVSFLDQIWGTRWSGGKNSYDQVRDLLNYSMRTEVRIPNACGIQKKDSSAH